MNITNTNFYNNIRDNIDLRSFLIFLLPIALIAGSAILNLILVLIFLIFIYDLFKKRDLSIFKNNWVYFFLIFWFYTVISSISFSGLDNSFKNSFSQIRFLTLILFMYQNLSLKSYTIFIKIILICLVFVAIDNNIQFFTGLSIFGFPAEGYFYEKRIYHLDTVDYYVGRLTGPFKDELIPGAFLTKLSTIILFYFGSIFAKFNNIKKLFFVLLILFLLQSILITGERTNSIFYIVLSFVLLINLINLRKAFFICIISVIFISTIIINSEFLKSRLSNSINIVNDYKNSSYGRLTSSASHLWRENLIFGVGLKNYRVKCNELIDPTPDHKYQYCSTHPHNTLLELLSETGIVGLILYLLFIISFLSKKISSLNNNIKITLNGFKAFIFLSLLPILPSGSLFTTWNATPFWIILGLYFFLSKKITQ
jgi:O-antigen ligase